MPAAPPTLPYDLAFSDERPAGGNLTGTPTAKPSNDAGFDPTTDEGAMTVYAVTINGLQVRGDTILAVRDGRLLVPATDLNRWRLVSTGATIDIDGQTFAPLNGVHGLTFQIDREQQQLQLSVPAEGFQTTRLLDTSKVLPPSEAASAAFVNYDATVQHTSGHIVAEGLFETGYSNRLGLIDNTMTVGNNPHGHDVVRLDTYVIHDDPGGLTRLTIGDTFTHSETWDPAVRFGGIKWGTDFSLQPGLLSFPTPTFKGQAQLPSNVQLYVNNVLNYTGQVDSGQFTLNRLPVVTGAGEVSVLVKDVLGVEHRVSTSYYVSAALLRPGLSDYSIEAGAERRRYSFESFDYGRAFIAGSFRHGVAPWLTLETRAEGAGDLQDVGGGFAALIGKIGEVGAAVSGSHGSDGSGLLYRIYASRIGQHWSLTATYQISSRDYMQLGQLRDVEHPRETLQVTGGANSRQFGSLSANVSYLRLSDGSRTRISTLTYGKQIAKLGYLSAFALRTWSRDPFHPEEKKTNEIGASFSMALGTNRSAFVQVDSHGRQAEIQKNVPDDKGWGYRAIAVDGENSQQEAELDYRGHAIDLSGTISRFDGATGERLLASGGFVFSGNSLLPTRKLEDSFAIVDVGNGQKGVRVLQENRQVTTTNGAGIAIVTNLRPYDANHISVTPEDLHLESTIANSDLVLVPRYFSGVLARFQVSNGRSGTLIIRLPDGNPVEPGTMLTTGTTTFYIGFDGEAFIDNMMEGMVLVAKRATGTCSVTVPALPKDIELPRIGPLTCRPQEPAK